MLHIRVEFLFSFSTCRSAVEMPMVTSLAVPEEQVTLALVELLSSVQDTQHSRLNQDTYLSVRSHQAALGGASSSRTRRDRTQKAHLVPSPASIIS